MTLGLAPALFTFLVALVLTGLAYLAFGATVAFIIFAVYTFLYLVAL